jgi:hypothetical protein
LSIKFAIRRKIHITGPLNGASSGDQPPEIHDEKCSHWRGKNTNTIELLAEN